MGFPGKFLALSGTMANEFESFQDIKKNDVHAAHDKNNKKGTRKIREYIKVINTCLWGGKML